MYKVFYFNPLRECCYVVWNESRQLYTWTDRGGWSGHTISGFIPYEWYKGTRYAVYPEYYISKTIRFLPLTFTKNK